MIIGTSSFSWRDWKTRLNEKAEQGNIRSIPSVIIGYLYTILFGAVVMLVVQRDCGAILLKDFGTE